MLFAKALFLPSIRISTVTTPAYIPFQPDFVSFVITKLETLLAYNAGRILFARLALPSDITAVKSFRAHSFA